MSTNESRWENAMPQNLNPKKSDVSVSMSQSLRCRLLRACGEDERSVSEVVREAVRRWLDSRDRQQRRRPDEVVVSPSDRSGN